MFESARLKLTAWYLLLIMLISGLFSVAFYNSSTREIQRIITRMEIDQHLEAAGAPFRVSTPRSKNGASLEDLKELRQKSFFTLIIINGLILFFSGVASYFLAGTTLRPIKVMIDEQNDFISNASHELRTPIATLRAEMESNLLEKKITDLQARSLIQSNLEEVATLQELTNNLLRLTQVETLKGNRKKKKTSLAAIVRTAHRKVSSLAKEKQINISLAVKDTDLLAQSEQLTEAVVIILDNAIKYSPAKSKIKVTSWVEKKTAYISVSDTGSGISGEDLPHIFNRFYRADKSRSEAEGYGLGLSIAKKIIQTHDGEIIATSEVGEGSTFTIQLPLS